jgi:hypothetical protein
MGTSSLGTVGVLEATQATRAARGGAGGGGTAEGGTGEGGTDEGGTAGGGTGDLLQKGSASLQTPLLARSRSQSEGDRDEAMRHDEAMPQEEGVGKVGIGKVGMGKVGMGKVGMGSLGVLRPRRPRSESLPEADIRRLVLVLQQPLVAKQVRRCSRSREEM